MTEDEYWKKHNCQECGNDTFKVEVAKQPYGIDVWLQCTKCGHGFTYGYES